MQIFPKGLPIMSISLLRSIFDRHVIRGEATLSLDTAKTGPLDLDTRDLNILQVTDDRGRPLDYEMGARDPILGQRLRIKRKVPCAKIRIVYETSPKASGIQWLTPEQTGGKKHPYLFTQSQAIHARSMLPLQDTPKARITYHSLGRGS